MEIFAVQSRHKCSKMRARKRKDFPLSAKQYGMTQIENQLWPSEATKLSSQPCPQEEHQGQHQHARSVVC